MLLPLKFLRQWDCPEYSPFLEDPSVTPLYHPSLNSIYVQDHCRNGGYAGWRRTSADHVGHLSQDNELCELEKHVLDEDSDTTGTEMDGNGIQTICQWFATKMGGLWQVCSGAYISKKIEKLVVESTAAGC